ncbi:MAG: helix-turn-helix domain-containing protein [Candidatus Lokiarchaeota archaeon]|nr:helix-turn-helix domain-containing protein [Candidatus Harpocratesius repetitus]
MEIIQNIQNNRIDSSGYQLETPELVKIAKALSSVTRQKILKELTMAAMDVSEIAAKLGQTEANISAQIAILQKAKLINCDYRPGGHGVRKVCSLSLEKLEILFQ